MSVVYDPETEKDQAPANSKSTGKDAEPSRAEKQEQDSLDKSLGGGFFKDEGKDGGKKQGFRQRAKNAFSGSTNKKKWVGAGIGGGALLFLVGLIVLFVSFFTIPHYAERITVYNFARSARNFRQSISQMTSERVWISNLDDTEYEAKKSRYQSLRARTWGKLDQYRPNKVFENMRATGQINFEYGEPSRITGQRKLTAVVIDGQRIEKDTPRFGRLISNRAGRIRFAAEVDTAMAHALRDHKTLVRGRVAKQLRSQLGIKLKFWEKNGLKYKNISKDAADRLLARTVYDDVKASPEDGAKVQNLDDAIDDTKQALDESVDDDGKLNRIINSQGDDLGEDVRKAATNAFGSSVASRVLNWTSTTYAVAEPLCIIYEGSVERSGGTIDARSESLQTQYYSLATAADQQKAGDTTGEAVGAFNRKIETTGNSPVDKRSRGETTNPEYVPPSPQASGIGTFSILDVLIGGAAADVAESIADPVCPVLTNVWVGAGLGALELTAAFLSGGSSAAAANGAKVTVREFLRQFASSFASRKAVTRFVRNGAITGGLTLIARLLVQSRAGLEYSGLAGGDNYITQSDMGADLHANEINRQQMYGRPLKDPEIAQEREADRQYIAQRRNERGFYDKYLNPENYDSFATMFASSAKGKVGSLFSSLGFLNPANVAGNAYNHFASNTAYAVVPEINPYGNIQWGWTAEETELMENGASYAPLENQKILEDSGKLNEIKEKYGPCYEETMGKIIEETWIQRDDDGTIKNDGKCSPKNLGRDNSEYGDLVFRWRLSNRNTNTFDHMIDIQDATLSGGSSPGTIGELPEGVITEADTALTRTGDIRVHKSIVDPMSDMVEAAAEDGLTLTGGGWRDTAKQIELRKKHCGTSDYDIYQKPSGQCSPPTATPGSSNHEKGLAVDFRCNGASMGSRSSPCFAWLDANAARFGFKNLPSEPWHWSVNGK